MASNQSLYHILIIAHRMTDNLALSDLLDSIGNFCVESATTFFGNLTGPHQRRELPQAAGRLGITHIGDDRATSAFNCISLKKNLMHQ